MAAGALFTTPQYLEPLERSGCVGPQRGWMPMPGTLATGSAPCYRKAHSWGEFVFDFEFAAAYEQHGLRYYPKQVCAVPFTPVPGPRLLAADDEGKRGLGRALMERTRAAGDSSAHVLFLPAQECELLRALGWLPRVQLRYTWSNAGDRSFAEFLGRLSSKKRKNIRHEREAVASSDLAIDWCAGAALTDAEWSRVHELYASTYHLRGQSPYLNLACLRGWAENFGESMQFCVARRDRRIVAMAFYFCDANTLYGRHWGSDADEPGLHFELCCYRGVEYCIEHGLERFDAGVQGDHRLQRGFEPELSYSAHWFAHEGFHGAIADALERETRMLQTRLLTLREHSAYRVGGA
jgi:predicted N-acyltransferase